MAYSIAKINDHLTVNWERFNKRQRLPSKKRLLRIILARTESHAHYSKFKINVRAGISRIHGNLRDDVRDKQRHSEIAGSLGLWIFFFVMILDRGNKCIAVFVI